MCRDPGAQAESIRAQLGIARPEPALDRIESLEGTLVERFRHVEPGEFKLGPRQPALVERKLERALELQSRGIERSTPIGSLTRGEQQLIRAERHGRVVLAVGDGLAEMVGGELHGLGAAIRRDFLDPLADAPVELAALGSRERRVDDVASESVLEHELAHPGHAGVDAV